MQQNAFPGALPQNSFLNILYGIKETINLIPMLCTLGGLLLFYKKGLPSIMNLFNTTNIQKEINNSVEKKVNELTVLQENQLSKIQTCIQLNNTEIRNQLFAASTPIVQNTQRLLTKAAEHSTSLQKLERFTKKWLTYGKNTAQTCYRIDNRTEHIEQIGDDTHKKVTQILALVKKSKKRRFGKKKN